MKTEKHVERGQEAQKIFNNRSLKSDYRTLSNLLKEGMTVLDVGCGTGAISKDIAKIVGKKGKVVGIDNTEKFIKSGLEVYGNIANLELIHSDIFDYKPNYKFDLVVSARTLQWLSNPKEALLRMKSFLKLNGKISVLDYNHNLLEWNPSPPESMQLFYKTFLKWRNDAGMNNQIAEELPRIFKEIGLKSISITNSDEFYDRECPNFFNKVGIWSKVASSKQMVVEEYLNDDLRLKAIKEYNTWIKDNAISMTMRLNEVRGKI
mgnify:CR=1 FL=1